MNNAAETHASEADESVAASQQTSNRPVGRPTKYDPAFCGRVIELGRLGKSRAWIASELNVSRECLEEWERNLPDFSDAMDKAMTHAQRWWEQAGQDGLTAGPGGFNAAVWSRSMAARFSRDWRDRHVKIDLPRVTDSASLLEAQARVNDAIARGKLDVEGAAVLNKSLADMGKSLEMLDMEKRLKAIEDRLGKN